MKIAVVGPTHPHKGGVAQHTTLLAHHLAARKHDVRLVSWSRQYPARLYPGRQTISEPETAPYPHTERRLSWRAPLGWERAGRELARWADLVVIAQLTPLQLPAYLRLVSAARRWHVPIVAICHNVIPHEPRPGDRALVRRFLRRVNRVIVHSAPEAQAAAGLTDQPVLTLRLPFFLPPEITAIVRPADEPVHRRLLFFGFVRPYKGLDDLLAAVASAASAPALRVAGELWGAADTIAGELARLGITDRVELRTDYVPAEDVHELFADVDALVVPYRSGTGSQHPRLAHHFGRPCIVTAVGDLPSQVRDGIDALVCPPSDVHALRAAIDELYQPGRLSQLRAAVVAPRVAAEWAAYGDGLMSLVGS